MNITLDELTHIYTVNGVVWPSVTQIINRVFPMRIPGQTDEDREYAMRRGSVLHKACELFDKGKLDLTTVHEAVSGKMKAWQNFREENANEILANEIKLAHPIYRYCGTIDRVLGDTRGDIICDIKSTWTPQSEWQLGAYSLLWKTKADKDPSAAVIVELQDDGNYRCRWMEKAALRRAEQEFLAILTVFNTACRHSISIGDSNGR